MFKLFAALAAAVLLSFAAAALPTSSPTSDDVLTFWAQLSGAQGRGSAVYVERARAPRR
jgi:ABC-type glycerol-3-phosphate transport system substrate-binding protein